MIIVVEGPDFAGKSTLVKKLESHHRAAGRDVTVYHTGQPSEVSTPLFIQYVGYIESALVLDNIGQVVIFDRLHIGEAIYGPIYRGASQISEQQMEVLDGLLDDAGALKVYIDTPTSELVKRFRGERGDDLVKDEEKLVEIAHEYKELLAAGRNRLSGWIRWTNAYEKMLGIGGAA